MNLQVLDYIKQEVTYQGYDISTDYGYSRVVDMVTAWEYAEKVSQERLPTIEDIISLGKLIEPEKVDGYRRMNVFHGITLQGFGLTHNSIARQMTKYVELLPILFPQEAYEEFEEIHPFMDGNGRVGKIIYNWLNHTLDKPDWPKEGWSG